MLEGFISNELSYDVGGFNVIEAFVNWIDSV